MRYLGNKASAKNKTNYVSTYLDTALKKKLMFLILISIGKL